MKKYYILLSIICTTILIIISGFSTRDSKADFIEIYRDSQYTIYSSRESSSSAWIKWQYPTKKVKNKAGKYILTGGKKKMQLWKCDCYGRNFDVPNMIDYDKTGKVTSSSNFGSYDNPVVPESIGELIFEHICSNSDESFNNYGYEMDSAAAVIDSAASVTIEGAADASTYR